MSNYNKLQSVLREIFEMDKADLDFGIYRIMNQKRDYINKFIDTQLPKDIKDILSKTQSIDGVQIQKELDQLGSGLDNAGVVRESSPKYLELKKALESSVDVSAMEQEIFSHLSSFFKRYYNEGDFISQRRYKKDVYAIPYEGEEVKLHWANADQYYIKTSEYLKNYAFVLTDKKKVLFQLKEASTEQNNNKSQGDGERRFAIYKEEPIEVDGNTLIVNFTYELHKKSVKQDDLIKKAFNTISSNIPVAFADICAAGSAPTEKNKARTLIEKHLTDYVSRNTFDYFIHKDLGAFLRRELDFYIKNEILYIDDINTESPAFFTAQLSKIKAFKTVADKIINFLAQIEDFQKKLWLKKKIVIRTDYCITIDRIPEKYHQEIVKNKGQVEEWKELFDVKVSKVEDLVFEQFLVLDTKHFSDEFKDKLIAEFYNLDEETNGLLINSENFQALNLMQGKYQEKVDTVYIDPPYNTNATPIVYKNEYKHSSWNSLISDRLILGKNLISEQGFNYIAIDHAELFNLGKISDFIFNEDNRIAIIAIQHNPKGRNQAVFFSENFEYMLCYSKNRGLAQFNQVAIDKEVLETFNERDEEGRYRWENFIRARTSWSKTNKPNNWYPLYVNEVLNKISELPIEGYTEVYPITNTGEFTWKSIKESFIQQNRNNFFRVFNENGKVVIKHKYREQQVFKNFWNQKKYHSEFNGTNLLKDILGSSLFSFPKSIFTVLDSLKITSKKESYILDYFSGSGTTAHATIKLNREDEGNRKYILVEMGTYFDSVTKPRVQKVIYSDNWKNGKPQDKDGISQLLKYQVLESYEDTLNNLVLAQKDLSQLGFDEEAQEEYLLQYMLDVESRDHLFNVEIFKNPFDYKLKVTENNELIPTKVDLVETFNYLIGLYVEHIQRTKDIKFVEGTTREGIKTLVIWRNLETTTNKETEEVFRKLFESERTSEFHQIYINGDHNLTNFRTGEDQFKVKMIEETFFNKMFNV